MNVTPIGTAISKWGEGPVWHEGRLLYVDIENHLIRSLDPETGDEKEWPVGERVGFVLPRSQGGLVMGGDNGIAFFDPDSGEKTPIARPDTNPDNRFNDGKCDPSGRIWAGTISTVKKTGDAALYCLDTDLGISLKFPNVTNSNGLAWSANGKTMFYIDTPSKKVRAFDFDATTGEISNERIAIDTNDFEGSPDGMTIDENDHLWIAFCHGGAVHCIDPANGEILKTINFPTIEVTSCTFGGPDYQTLYVTSGVKDGEALSGRVFAVKAGVKGRPADLFAG